MTTYLKESSSPRLPAPSAYTRYLERLALPPCAGRSPLRRACVLALLRAKGVGV